LQLRDLGPGDEALLRRFYDGVYLDEFASQREPIEAWLSALRGEQPYRWHLRIALDGDDILGGCAYEVYPRSNAGFITYMVVRPDARGRGIGRSFFVGISQTLYGEGIRAVLGEVKDPRVHGEAAVARLRRFERWGARVLDVPYVQPSLGEGLSRDHGLCLILHPGGPDGPVPADTVRTFLVELYAATEGSAPDEGLLARICDPIRFRDGE
jgi:GNAT superfamily N-acetyltransferase